MTSCIAKDLINGISTPVSGSYRNVDLDYLLQHVVTAQMGLGYEVIDKTVILRKGEPALIGKENRLRHRYRRARRPVIGASVIISGSTKGVATDMDGRFTLNDVPANGSFNISYIGYKPVTVHVNGRSSFSLSLIPDQQKLDGSGSGRLRHKPTSKTSPARYLRSASAH